jgi:hypothetical protein
MTRRKGEITARMNERDYPHIVELALPDGGFGRELDAMHDFRRLRGIERRRGRRQRRDDREFVRWCFASVSTPTTSRSSSAARSFCKPRPADRQSRAHNTTWFQRGRLNGRASPLPPRSPALLSGCR